jgi:hypothetical protein
LLDLHAAILDLVDALERTIHLCTSTESSSCDPERQPLDSHEMAGLHCH